MIDLDKMRRAAADGENDAVVTRRFLKQALEEIEAGRAAQAQLARLGMTFGLGNGVIL